MNLYIFYDRLWEICGRRCMWGHIWNVLQSFGLSAHSKRQSFQFLFSDSVPHWVWANANILSVKSVMLNSLSERNLKKRTLPFPLFLLCCELSICVAGWSWWKQHGRWGPGCGGRQGKRCHTRLRASLCLLLLSLSVCDSRKSTRPAKPGGVRTRSSSSPFCVWGTKNTFSEVSAGVDTVETFEGAPSWMQFRLPLLVFDEYLKISGRNIEDSIKREMSGSLEDVFLAVGASLLPDYRWNVLPSAETVNSLLLPRSEMHAEQASVLRRATVQIDEGKCFIQLELKHGDLVWKQLVLVFRVWAPQIASLSESWLPEQRSTCWTSKQSSWRCTGRPCTPSSRWGTKGSVCFNI